MLSERKSQIGKKEIQFLGMNFKNGHYSPGGHIAQELLHFPDDNLTRKQIQQFLGIINYLKDFLPRVTIHTSKLSRLLRKNAVDWGPEQTTAVKQLKLIAQDPPALQISTDGQPLMQTTVGIEHMGASLIKERDKEDTKSKRQFDEPIKGSTGFVFNTLKLQEDNSTMEVTPIASVLMIQSSSTKKKLRALPAVQRSCMDYTYSYELWSILMECIEHKSTSPLPEEIARDIMKRKPSCFNRWSEILKTIWDGKTDGRKLYDPNAVIHKGHESYHSTVFIRNHDFFKMVPWSFIELFELGFLNGFILGRTNLSEDEDDWGIDPQVISSLAPDLARELLRWYEKHGSIHVWIDTIPPEWSQEYFTIYEPIHLVRIVPTTNLVDWKLIHWPARPKIRKSPTWEYFQPESITYMESNAIRGIAADSMRRNLETNIVDKPWRIFHTVLETTRTIIQGYRKVKTSKSLAAQVIRGHIPMTPESKEIWEDAQMDGDTYCDRSD